jgi:hypothetical protein
MMRGTYLLRLLKYSVATLALVGVLCGRAYAQASPTATREVGLSAFGLVSGVHTGFDSSKNLSLTAGADLGFQPHCGLYPALEIRGTLPLASGDVASQKNFLAGLKLEKPYGRVTPYVNFLVGRTEFRYKTFPFTPDFSSYYVQSTSNLFSPGGGVDFSISDQLSFKLDAQVGLYSSPVTVSGRGVQSSVSVGLNYRFALDGRRKAR